MRVPAAEQRLLLELQSHDTRLARLTHEARSLPVQARLTAGEAAREEQDTERIRLEATCSDQRRELARLEADIEKVVNRRQRHEERLGAGGVPAKEVVAIQAEIDHLRQRQSILEDEQLEAMEEADATEGARAFVASRIAELDEQLARDGEEKQAELARLRAAAAAVQAQRDTVALQLPSGLVELYDAVRRETGGLGVVGLSGTTTEGVSIDFTLSERDAIRTADPDEVLQSEEHGYILVRL